MGMAVAHSTELLFAFLPLPNNALERSVKGSEVGAAGARTIVARAAPGSDFPRPA